MPKTCAMPGCESTLYPGNKTGLCRQHNHQAPYCECFQCTRKAPPKKSPNKPTRDNGKRAASVPVHTTYSGISKSADVSLPVAPWEDV